VLLPGGADVPAGGVAVLAAELRRDHSYLDAPSAERLAGTYGTEARRFFAAGDPGRHFGHGLFEAEVRWLVEHEWARTAEDVLWRRTKLGLHFSPDEATALDDYLATRFARLRRVAASAAPIGQTPYR
jgi:glycerol-3-phosphate dehydrogenase